MNKLMTILSFVLVFTLMFGIVSAAYGSDGIVHSSTDASVETSSSGSASSDTDTSASASAESNNGGNRNVLDIVSKINLRTGLNISVESDTSLGALLRVYLSNGKYALVKILPATASLTAQENLKAKCEERNCTVELKEVSVNGEARAAYEVKTQKQAKVLGIFNAKMDVEADVDAETGAVIAVKKPWWASFSSEVDESSSVQAG